MGYGKIITKIVLDEISEGVIQKRGEWVKKEVPPEVNFQESEVFMIGHKIIEALNGMLADRYLM